MDLSDTGVQIDRLAAALAPPTPQDASRSEEADAGGSGGVRLEQGVTRLALSNIGSISLSNVSFSAELSFVVAFLQHSNSL